MRLVRFGPFSSGFLGVVRAVVVQSLERKMVSAVSLFSAGNARFATAMPVGICVTRTALSVVFTSAHHMATGAVNASIFGSFRQFGLRQVNLFLAPHLLAKLVWRKLPALNGLKRAKRARRARPLIWQMQTGHLLRT